MKQIRFSRNLSVLALLAAMGAPARAECGSCDSVSCPAGSSHALQFQLVGGFGLNYVSRMSQQWSWRAGVDVGLSFSTNKGSSSSESSGSSGIIRQNTTDESKPNAISLYVTASYLWLWNSKESFRTSLYAGAGPTVSYGYSKSGAESTSEYHSAVGNTDWATTRTSDSKSHSSSAGIAAVVGVSSRLAGPVSLTAELNLSGTYSSSWSGSSGVSTSVGSAQAPTSGQDSYNSDSRGWGIRLQGVRMGVLVDL